MSRPTNIKLSRRGDLFDVSYRMPDGYVWPGAQFHKSFTKMTEATDFLLQLLAGAKTALEFTDGDTACSWVDLATNKRPPAPLVVEKKE